jgi:hypothetical protein
MYCPASTARFSSSAFLRRSSALSFSAFSFSFFRSASSFALLH